VKLSTTADFVNSPPPKFGHGKDAARDSLPREAIVGNVELLDRDGGKCHLRRWQRATKLVEPK